MIGDFSRVQFRPGDNFNGILPQQGKVLLDSDGIAATLIENDWRQTAARDIVGNLAGVPAAAPDSFSISAATLTAGAVSLTVGTGRIWADGLLVRLGEPGSTVTRTATWIEPPIVPTEGDATNVADGVTDAVILEVWQNALNAFQVPGVLLEPALGGPDTAERLQTSFAFRLARLSPGATCASLAFDESGRGHLTASLVPPVVTAGDCPVEGAGGYSGFEHQLYRIQVADTTAAASQFKWSRVNGGLVGRGAFDPVTQKITITSNLAAINGVNQSSFYLEIEQYDDAAGYWKVASGAQAALSAGVLQCTAAPAFGTYPAAAGTVFFRLWDGLSPVSAFPLSATPAQLENGILLQFDADAPGKYLPGDYWMFPVRAQGIPNPTTLIDAKPPEGIRYHRVPLAEITWSGAGGSFTAGDIEYCRTIVPPLSRKQGCCTCHVGDGVTSFGDFTHIQAAVDSLPPEGGEICLLPGLFRERVHIYECRDIVVHGCGWQTRVASPLTAPPAAPSDSAPINNILAVFSIANSRHIVLRDFAIEADDTDAGVLIDGQSTTLPGSGAVYEHAASVNETNLLRGAIDVTLQHLVITAAALPAVLAQRVELLRIASNRIAMKNVRSTWPAVFASGREIHIADNWVGLQSLANDREWLPDTVVADLATTADNQATTHTSGEAAAANFAAVVNAGPLHPGGIQIGGPSTDVYILRNEIEGGSRNGITLGSYEILDTNSKNTLQWVGVLVNEETDDCCTGTLQPPGTTTGGGGGRVVASGLLVNIHIHCNRIRNMGLCGIGPVGFFDLEKTLEIITIDGLHICENSITSTVQRNIQALTAAQAIVEGYGAISIPDVDSLIIRGNTITDFGATPGARVCGVFVLHGEGIEISGNQITETSDWAAASTDDTTTGARGGIMILTATPPEFEQPLSTSSSTPGLYLAAPSPIYQPGLPALRVFNNLVRVPLNYAFCAFGFGPFEVASNHFACGGRVTTKAALDIAQTVLIVNLGTAIELAQPSTLPSGVYTHASGSFSNNAASVFQTTSSGAVSFTGNVCQFEGRANRQVELSSVCIITPDHLIFSNNHCWLDASRLTAALDAFLVSGSLNVIGNRFQEAVNSVLASGITSGNVNVTGQNISTYCLFVLGATHSNNNNLVVGGSAEAERCAAYSKKLFST